MNMADEAKHSSPICSTSEALVVLCAVGHCYRKELGSFSLTVLAAALQFSVHLIDLMTILLRYNRFSRAQKAVVSRPAADHQTVTMILFLVILSFPKQNFGKCPGASEFSHLELIVAGCPIQSIFPRTSQSSQEMVSSSCEE